MKDPRIETQLRVQDLNGAKQMDEANKNQKELRELVQDLRQTLLHTSRLIYFRLEEVLENDRLK
jgi:hypothetical protein